MLRHEHSHSSLVVLFLLQRAAHLARLPTRIRNRQVTFIIILMIVLWIITFGTDTDGEIRAWRNRRRTQ